jgi:hypothetical protein
MVAPWDLNPYAYAGQNPAQLWDPDGAADLPITSERYADVARDFIGQHGYEPNVVQLMEHEKEMEAAGVFGARDRTIDKFTMNDAIARGIEWAEREYMINAATGYGGKLIFFGGKAVGGAAIRSAILASRATVALSFMIRGGVKVSNALRYLKGFDLGRPVVVRTLQKGTIIIQWVNKETGLVGRWFAPVGTKMTELGIEGKRGVQLFRVNRDIEVLEGTAADFPSASGGEMLPGGGQQYFLGSDVPTEVTDPLPVPAGGPPLPGMTPPAPGP